MKELVISGTPKEVNQIIKGLIERNGNITIQALCEKYKVERLELN